VRSQEYRNELLEVHKVHFCTSDDEAHDVHFYTADDEAHDVHFCTSDDEAHDVHFYTADDALVVRNILSFLYTNSISVCETTCDTLLRYR
jgi:hypothetical protein